MNYKNTTPTPIYVKIDGKGQLINPGEEVVSNSTLVEFGLTALIEEEPKKVSPSKTPSLERKVTAKSKPVNINELTTTNKTKD